MKHVSMLTDISLLPIKIQLIVYLVHMQQNKDTSVENKKLQKNINENSPSKCEKLTQYEKQVKT